MLRRPPLGELLPTAHDMGREFTLISALWPTPVPVPEPLAYCDDLAVTGARFYAMGWVEGRSLYTAEDVEGTSTRRPGPGPAPRSSTRWPRCTPSTPTRSGLGDLGKRDSYVGRQLHRWYESWKASKDRELPDVDRLHDFLVERLPEQTTVSVVHGDYGLHNCRVAADGPIAAVVDWEISTLGDPLADLAYCINAWVESPDEVASREDAPTILPGFSSRQELHRPLRDRDRRRPRRSIEYYRCFNHWKTVCILQGVYARYLHGQKAADEGVEVDEFPDRIDRSLQLAVTAGPADSAAHSTERRP